MSSPVGYPQRGAYPMFSSTSQGDVPVGKNGTNLIPVMAKVSPSSGVVVVNDQAGYTSRLHPSGKAPAYFDFLPAWDFDNVTSDKTVNTAITYSIDEAVTYCGKPTLRIDIDPGFTGALKLAGTTGMTAYIPEGFDGSNVVCAVMSTTPTMFTSLQMYVGDATYANHWVRDQNRQGYAEPPGYSMLRQPLVWAHFKVGDISDPGTMPVGSGTPVAAQRMRAKVTTTIATPSSSKESIWLGFFGTVPPRKKPTIMLTFDDGYRTWFEHIVPLCRYYDLPLSMGMIGGMTGDTPGVRMSIKQAQQLANDSSGLFDLVNHTYDHAYLGSGWSENDWIASVVKNRDWMINTLGVIGDGPLHVMYPGGNITATAIQQLKALGFRSGRSTERCWRAEQDQLFAAGDDNRFFMSVATPMETSGVSVASVKAKVDEIITKKQAAILQAHNFGKSDTAGTWNYANIEQIFKYVADKRCAGLCEVKSWTRYYSDIDGRKTHLR